MTRHWKRGYLGECPRLGLESLFSDTFRIPFTLAISQLLPPYTRSPFDLTMSRLFVSILQPSPEYEAVQRDSVDTSSLERIGATSHPDSPSTSVMPPSCAGEPTEEQSKRGLLDIFRSRRKSSKSVRADQPIPIPNIMAIKAYDRAWRRADIPPPMALRPSLVNDNFACGLVSSPDNPGEEPSMEWEKTMRIPGLGKVECLAYSSYVCVSVVWVGAKVMTLMLLAVCLRLWTRLSSDIHRARTTCYDPRYSTHDN